MLEFDDQIAIAVPENQVLFAIDDVIQQITEAMYPLLGDPLPEQHESTLTEDSSFPDFPTGDAGIELLRTFRAWRLKDDILGAASAGVLVARDRCGQKLPVECLQRDSEIFVSRDDLLRVAGETWMIKILDGGREAQARPASVQQHVYRSKERVNILDPAIRKAIKNAGSSDAAAVFLALRNLALLEEPLFTGGMDGGALVYTDDNRRTKNLSKSMLAQRLARRRQRLVDVDSDR